MVVLFFRMCVGMTPLMAGKRGAAATLEDMLQQNQPYYLEERRKNLRQPSRPDDWDWTSSSKSTRQPSHPYDNPINVRRIMEPEAAVGVGTSL